MVSIKQEITILLAPDQYLGGEIMRRYNVLFIVIVLMLTLTGCKYPTLEKAIAETIPFDVQEVLYKKKN